MQVEMFALAAGPEMTEEVYSDFLRIQKKIFGQLEFSFRFVSLYASKVHPYTSLRDWY